MNTQPNVFDTLSTMGNSEMKAIALGSMQSAHQYGAPLLQRTIADIQGTDPVWVPRTNAVRNYLHTFESGQLVRRSNDADSSSSYSVTDYGADFATSLAGHVLQLSAATGIPLVGFFGPTNSTSATHIRASERRYKLMELLVAHEGKPVALAAVADVLSVRANHAGTTVQALAAYALAEHQSTGRGRPGVVYVAHDSLAHLSFKQDSGSELRSAVVAELIRHHECHADAPIHAGAIADKLYTHHTTSRTEMRAAVGGILDYISKYRSGLTKIRVTPQSSHTREQVFATDTQLEKLVLATSLVRAAHTNSAEFSNAGRKNLAQIFADQSVVRDLVIIARNASLGRKTTRDMHAVQRNEIRTAVDALEQPVTVTDITEYLRESGSTVSRSTVTAHMQSLVENGTVNRTHSRRGWMFVKIK